METKEELIKKLKEIEEKEINQIIDAAYPEFKKMIGKCFRFKNGYGYPYKKSEYWWKYSKVTELKKKDLYIVNIDDVDNRKVLASCKVMSFQKDISGKIEISLEEESHIHGLGTEIPKEDFNKAWNQIIKHINSLGRAFI